MRTVTLCRAPLCHAEAKFDGFCRTHAPVHLIHQANGHDEPQPYVMPVDLDEDDEQLLPELDDLDEREPGDDSLRAELAHAAELKAGAPRVKGPGIARWTRENAIAAIQQWTNEHGRPPRQLDAKGDDSIPSPGTVREFGMTWADLIEQAGFPRPVRGGAVRPPVTDEARQRISDGMYRETARREATWHVNVPGTGLRYRTAMEAYAAAEEIEGDGERVAEDARFDGDEEKATQATDTARDLAERVRIAARMAERAEANGTTRTKAEPVFPPPAVDVDGDLAAQAAELRKQAEALRARADALAMIARGLDQLAGLPT